MGCSAVIAIGVAALWIAQLAPPVLAQESSYHDEMASKIEAKRDEIRRHTEAMESVDDPEALQQEMQKHFRMTEELLGWVVEHQKQRLAAASQPARAPPSDEEGAASGGMDHRKNGTGGGKAPGSKGGMGHGKKGKRGVMAMGGMGHQGHNGNQGGHGMAMDASPTGSAAAPSVASAAAARIAEREALLQEITTHSLFLEGLTDARERARETVRHQQMLDRLVALMQE